MEKITEKIILLPSQELPISKQLKEFMVSEKCKNIYSLLTTYSASDLLDKDNFNHHMLIELYYLLKKHDLANIIRE